MGSLTLLSDFEPEWTAASLITSRLAGEEWVGALVAIDSACIVTMWYKEINLFPSYNLFPRIDFHMLLSFFGSWWAILIFE